ncbi:MAG: portal protein [Candidatus Peribacteraceae bacterium]|nr:portal protein [Candidatus Peribacteraceae bacterium]
MAFTSSPLGRKFGYERKVDVSGAERNKLLKRKSVIEVDKDDGSVIIDAGSGFNTTAITLSPIANSVIELINEYREIGRSPEADTAIDDIINEAVTVDTDEEMISLDLDGIKGLSDNIKDLIKEEFEIIIKMLKFDTNGYDVFRQWYEDGRLYVHKVIDVKSPSKGIRQLTLLDPRAMTKIKELVKGIDDTGVETIDQIKIYFHFDPSKIPVAEGISQRSYTRQILELSEESVAYIHSGLIHPTKHFVIGYLDKARKSANNLRMMEDALAIYRIARAPERRLFYIDVGSLPAKSAETYVKTIMDRYKNKISYDVATGKVKSNTHEMTLLEDFWLPRREGSNGTEISNLQGGDRLGIIDDVEYFQKKLYKSLNVPYSRVDSENTVSLGARAAEITRDEIKFSKFIFRLRRRFSELFTDILETQVILKKVMTQAEWLEIKKDISYVYSADNIIQEQREAELLEGRVTLLRDISEQEGKYFSREYIQKHVLRMDEDEIKSENEQMKKEKAEGLYDEEEDEEGGGFG